MFTKDLKPPILIAECGNNHEGSLPDAHALIDAAANAGADLVKFQAGTARAFARTPDKEDFYQKYVLQVNDFIALALYGYQKKIPVFFSIWNDETNQDYETLRAVEKYHKIPARQCTPEIIAKYDSPNTFVSIPLSVNEYEKLPIKESVAMHVVEEYPCYEPRLWMMKVLKKYFNKVGFSDHTIGIENAVFAVKEYGAYAVEKHFTLDIHTQGLRDHQLSADPKEFERLARLVK